MTENSEHGPSTERAKIYQINLSLPPQRRYNEICADFKTEFKGLFELYQEMLSNTLLPRFLGWLAKVSLRKVYSKEENEEIRGISEATGLPVHVIVAFNSFVDMSAGCTTGGARLSSPSEKMVHFRNLDWHMDPLRKLTIQVEYVVNGDVVARAVTYAGYVGVLTGVRQGLSISFNSRPRTFVLTGLFWNYLHYLLVLLGCRRSISSYLRKILLAPGPASTLDALIAELKHKTTSSCFLTFCSPSAVLVVEKDLHSAHAITSNEFLTVTNHDVEMESWTEDQWRSALREMISLDLYMFLRESICRKKSMSELWDVQRGCPATTVDDVKSWLKNFHVKNSYTHFSCIMDPSEQGGGLIWLKRYRDRLDY